jgi:hypothetical protein
MDFLVGGSNSGIHQLDWDPYIAALKADGTTVNDMNANATLPTSVLSTIILCRSANGRAVGLDTPLSCLRMAASAWAARMMGL